MDESDIRALEYADRPSKSSPTSENVAIWHVQLFAYQLKIRHGSDKTNLAYNLRTFINNYERKIMLLRVDKLGSLIILGLIRNIAKMYTSGKYEW